MQDPEIALKHANVISHACKLSGLLLASMHIREILCGCVWLLSQFMDDEFETCFCSKPWCGELIVLPELDIWLLMTTKSVTALCFQGPMNVQSFSLLTLTDALGRSTRSLKKEFLSLPFYLTHMRDNHQLC